MTNVDAALSKSRSSTLRGDSGKQMYIITTRRITSGDELKYRNGLVLVCEDGVSPHPTLFPDHLANQVRLA